MSARAFRISSTSGREVAIAVGASLLTLVFGLLATHKWGMAGLLLPLLAVLAVLLLQRPVLAMCLAVGLTILCERSDFGLFTFTESFYDSVVKDVTIQDLFVALAVFAVALDMLNHPRPLRVPGPLRAFLVLILLAMIGSAVNSHAYGKSIHYAILSEATLAYLVVVPVAVVNMRITPARLRQLLFGLLALAVLKAGIGLVELASGHSLEIEESGHLTYYEATANWVIMIALFSVIAALIMRLKPPRWLLLPSVLLFASLLLSYRRSFWIAALLGVAVIVLLGTRPAGKRVLLPLTLALVAGIWAVSSVPFQSSSPLVKRAASLAPSKLEANKSDRYRIDERVNVEANIREHPITGLGLDVPWKREVRPLSIESSEEQGLYVHFAVLWYWVKLGVLGLFAYLSLLIGTAVLAWRVARHGRDKALRAFGLASLGGVAGMAVMEATATFAGADSRFTLVLAAQAGLLALAGMGGSSPLTGREQLA
jgi:general stress protein CsbA